MADKNIKMVTNQAGDHPADYYSWGDESKIGIISRKEQFTEQLGEAFDSIEIKEDAQTPELDYVLKVLGKEAGRIIIPFNMVVKDAYYDKETKEIVIIFRIGEEEKEIRFSVSDLIDIYTGDEVTIHVENNVISITKQVMDTIDTLGSDIDGIVITKESDNVYSLYVKGEKHGEITIPKSQFLKSVTYDKATKELVFIFDTEEGEKEQRVSVADLIDVYEAGDGLKLTGNVFSVDFNKVISEDELNERTKNMVEWDNDSERKHLVLNNHDNIIGVSTDGTEYNLAMVSKWDVADFGSSSLPMNLNSKDGVVMVNDKSQVVTSEDTIPLSSIEALFA